MPQITQSRPAGTTFELAIDRAGKRLTIHCTTRTYKGKPRFGIIISTTTQPISLPVNVTFNVKDINGSSAGLMFALQIYRTLTGSALASGKNIAGTGVLASDGEVLPVGGAKEKLQAAIKQHAAVFLVPANDFTPIAGAGAGRIIIVPVKSFADALKKLKNL